MFSSVITIASARIGDKPRFNLAHAVKIARVFIKGSPIPVELQKDFHTAKVGGVSFVSFQVEWTLKAEKYTEVFYVVLRRDYALVFSVGAEKPEGIKKGKKALESLRFNLR